MNIKKVIRNTSILFAPFIIIILVIISFLILKKDMQNSHLPYAFGRDKINISAYYIEVYFQKVQNFFDISNKKKLKKIEFSISEQGLSKLISNVPMSVRTYVRGDILMDSLGAKKIRFRYKGSNPYNWLFEQKEIRVKTRKKDLINRQRYFDYRISQSEILNDYAYFKFASLINQLSYDVELVDVKINNIHKGIHLQREVINEGFLRRKKIMPINTYSGEQKRYDDRNMSLNNNLFFNKALWEKISIMNTIPVNDFTDLENFLKTIENLSLTNSDFQPFLENNLEHFADVAAFQIITQFVVFDNFHNIRIALDPWSGKKFIIIHDGAFQKSPLLGRHNFDRFLYENQLFLSLSKNPIFLNSVYKSLDKILNKEKYLDKIIQELYLIEEEYKNSFKKDIGHIQRKYLAYIENENEDYFSYFINFLLERKKEINEILFKNPTSSWHKEKKMFFLKVDDKMPLTNVELEFNNKFPESIIYDFNNNKKIDSEDLYFYPDKNGKITIKGNFFSNRINFAQSNILKITNNYQKKIKTVNTKFGFFLNENFKIKNIYALNNYNKTKFLIKKEINKSHYPYAHNIPLFDKKTKKILLKGEINVEKNIVYDDEVIIEKGTNFILCRTCSLIFKNKVIAEGNSNNPIVFQGKNKDYWGTLALFGKKTKGSKLEGVIIKNATGGIINNINFFSALSIHLAENIKINNLIIESNNFYDDMLHIIYSKDIIIKNSKFYNSYADAIDVDISDNVKFHNINIFNAKNDGIDFMESNAEIHNAIIIGSGDKAISVGENSNLKITNSKLSKNKYGLVAKDNSIVDLKKTHLMDNEIQLAVYKKNWRYGKSGQILASEIIFNEKKSNLINKDNEGKIIFFDNLQNKNLKIIEVDELEFN